MIATVNLSKSYGRFPALRDLTMEVRKGEVFGLLGPNGSGKTTAIRLLLGLLRPTAGSAQVSGLDCWSQSLEVRRRVAFLPGEIRLPGDLTGYGLLKFLSSLRGGVGLDRAVSIAERVMKLDLRKKIRNFSTGMKQKLALAQVFADPVETLILDEPTSALDPTVRSDILGLVAAARTAGQTVIFSGHVLSEVEQVADRVAILRKGRLMHVEDMHARRNLRMLQIRFEGEPPSEAPDELMLTVRDKLGADVWLLEHRGELGPLLTWLASQRINDVAIGNEDLRSLYDRYHGPDVKDTVDLPGPLAGAAAP